MGAIGWLMERQRAHNERWGGRQAEVKQRHRDRIDRLDSDEHRQVRRQLARRLAGGVLVVGVALWLVVVLA